MGTPYNSVKQLLEYEAQGLVPSGSFIAELGAQEFHPPLTPGQVQEIYQRVRPGEVLPEVEAERISKDRYTSALYEALGFRYISFDVFIGRSTRHTDLNQASVPEEYAEKVDLVTNFGTTEHIINQLNCFKFAHDLTRAGGLMWHVLPASDYIGHGFFKYDPSFFVALANANGYKIMCWDFTPSIVTDSHTIPDYLFTLGLPRIEARASAMQVVFQKMHGSPFRLPIDAPITVESVCLQLGGMKAGGRHVIYGTGNLGRTLAQRMDALGMPIGGFIDSNKSGQSDGRPVWRLDEYPANAHPDDRIVIASMYAEEIKQQLVRLGLSWVAAVTHL